MAIIAGNGLDQQTRYKSCAGSTFINYFMGSIYLVLFLTLFEGITKGRTLGKLTTGTKAVKEDGSSITWKDAFVRSLCRIVLFEQFNVLVGIRASTGGPILK